MVLSQIPPGKKVPEEIHVIVEIPKGSQNKYEFDKEYGILRLDRVLFSPLYYPGDYGFVPQTLGLDGDPLDALVLVTHPTLPGTLIEARPIGVLELKDRGKVDDKILCVPIHDIRFARMQDIADIEEAILKEIAHFFAVYKELEGKKVDVIGWQNASKAHQIILQAVERAKK